MLRDPWSLYPWEKSQNEAVVRCEAQPMFHLGGGGGAGGPFPPLPPLPPLGNCIIKNHY